MRIFSASLADTLCFYRVAAAITALVIGPYWLIPWVFGLALLTDVLDGWAFRCFAKDSQYWAPWNPLMISVNQASNIVFILCGLAYFGRYGLGWPVRELLAVDAIVVAGAWVLTVIPELELLAFAYDTVYTVCMTARFHLSCLLMLASTAGVWYINVGQMGYLPGPWLLYAAVNIALFYGLYAAIGEPKRWVRRPEHTC